MTEILYLAHVSSRRLFGALNTESNLARYIIQFPTQVSREIYSWAAIEEHQAIFHSKQIRLMRQVLKYCGFSGVSSDGNSRPSRLFHVQL